MDLFLKFPFNMPDFICMPYSYLFNQLIQPRLYLVWNSRNIVKVEIMRYAVVDSQIRIKRVASFGPRSRIGCARACGWTFSFGR